jgi:hypothetical protein
MDEQYTRRLRVRWAAIGAAVAVSLGAGGLGLTHASIGTGERNVFVPITPCRLIDTRPAPDTVGSRSTPLASGETLAVQVTGANGNCTIPADATAVAANVVAVAPSAAGFFTLFPANVSRPLSANLNFVAGAPPTPNKVDVKLSPDGKLSVFNFTGTAHLVLDVFGYYADHNHDDRYQPKGNYLQNSVIVMQHSHADWVKGGNGMATVDLVSYFGDGARVDNTQWTGAMLMPLIAPSFLGGTTYRLKTVRWCLTNVIGAIKVLFADVVSPAPTSVMTRDNTQRTSGGCQTINPDAATSAKAGLTLSVTITGNGSLLLTNVETTWELVP